MLHKIEFLDRLPENDLINLLVSCEIVSVRKQQVVFRRGEEQAEAIILLCGALALQNSLSHRLHQNNLSQSNMDLQTVPDEFAKSNDTASAVPELAKSADSVNVVPGDALGFKALFSEWGQWPISCVATQKAEVPPPPLRVWDQGSGFRV